MLYLLVQQIGAIFWCIHFDEPKHRNKFVADKMILELIILNDVN